MLWKHDPYQVLGVAWGLSFVMRVCIGSTGLCVFSGL